MLWRRFTEALRRRVARIEPPGTTGSTPCTSWRSASACAVGNFSGSAGRISTLRPARWKWFKASSGSGGRLQFVRPKTSDSERTVPLPPICVEALREHRRKLFAERSDRGEEWTEHGLVFPSHCGTPMEPDNLRRSWGAIRKAAGLGEMRFHDLRHTCVTLLLNLGVPPRVVRAIVGHSDIEVTMTIYAHASLDDKRNALRKLGDTLK
ncbi:tyrosine-type recombinase/integrase [Microbispora sitophila]|uniref:tyrosine-type recombinase/integrase n=1 Tax=Microbispora sitophila TaxID=2771537 RepID=UPI001D033F4B|nr:site-specific integrase [Microbispora sitophila]